MHSGSQGYVFSYHTTQVDCKVKLSQVKFTYTRRPIRPNPLIPSPIGMMISCLF